MQSESVKNNRLGAEVENPVVPQNVFQVSMKQDGRRVKVEQITMGVTVRKERTKSIKRMATREEDGFAESYPPKPNGASYMVLKKTLMKCKETQFKQIQYVSGSHSKIDAIKIDNGKYFITLEQYSEGDLTRRMDESQSDNGLLSKGQILKIHRIKRQTQLLAYFIDKELEINERMEGRADSVHDFTQQDQEEEKKEGETTQKDESSNTQSRLYDFAKNYSTECSVMTSRLHLSNPMKKANLDIKRFLVSGDHLLVTLKETNQSIFFVYNALTGNLLEHHDLSILFPNSSDIQIKHLMLPLLDSYQKSYQSPSQLPPKVLISGDLTHAPYLLLYDRYHPMQKSVYRTFPANSQAGPLSYGPYDNGPILMMQSPGHLLGLSAIDLTTIYNVDMTTLGLREDASLISKAAIVAMEPAQMLFVIQGRHMLAIQMIEKECEYMYVEVGQKDYCLIVVKKS